MKKFELFGFIFTFKINRKNYDDAERYSEESRIREKVFYILAMLSIIVLSSRVPHFFDQIVYNTGDIATSDIYAPKSIIYNDRGARDEIVKDLIKSSEKKYIFSPDIKEIYLLSAETFFDNVANTAYGENNIYLESIKTVKRGGVSKNLAQELYFLEQNEFEQTRADVINFLNNAYDSGIKESNETFTLSTSSEENFNTLSPLEKNIVSYFLTANYIYDNDQTKAAILEKTSQIDNQFKNIKAGTLIVSKGEVISQNKTDLLNAFGIYSYRKGTGIFLTTALYLIIIISIFYPVLVTKYKTDILDKNTYRALFLIYLVGFLAYRFINLKHIYAIPFSLIFFLLSILFRKEFSLLSAGIFLAFLFPLVGYDSIFILTTLLTSTMGNYLVRKITTRQGLIALGIKLSITKFFLYLLASYFYNLDPSIIAIQSGEIIFSGLVSGMLTIALLPYFERTFNFLTNFRLLELGDLSHPLLKLLSVQAPGTFHHSMMVATLSEAGAEAIGANYIFARVASYYHDIGKLKRPKFYVENQNNAENLHNKLSPSLSALIIKSHTKDGTDLGKEYGIPKEIRDVMVEHQGTTMLAYFYNKAKQLDPSVSEDDFKYGGPVPRSKESAIIMLADSVEAAVRSLDVKTSVTIENMLRKIIKAKIDDNQLAEASLTFKEIEIIIKTFTKVLSSIHHVRIKYPGQK